MSQSPSDKPPPLDYRSPPVGRAKEAFPPLDADAKGCLWELRILLVLALGSLIWFVFKWATGF